MRISSVPAHTALLLRTVAHLRPAQVTHRVRLRTLKAILAREPTRLAERWRRALPDDPGWPEAFGALDRALVGGCPSAEDNAAGRFAFLADARDLGDPIHWEPPDASQLWRYHLHYFEWAWALVEHPDREWAQHAFAALFESWDDAITFGRWDAWSPYVVSVRAWVLCDLYAPLVRGTELEARYLDVLARHAGFVRHNLELDVGGNHLVKNIKALLGLGVFMRDEDLVARGTSLLLRELVVQVLADGGHFERSPSYHAQVLGDLTDIAGLLRADGRRGPAGLDDAIRTMRAWLGAMLRPDGTVPLVNDAVAVDGARLVALGVPGPTDSGELTVLDPSGYVVVNAGQRLHMLIDVGPPCPDELPAHAHADCLSFALTVDGTPVVVDTGTSTYAPGARRRYERSTLAHSTIEVDGYDQTEVWGTFRAARLAHPTVEITTEHDDGTIEVAASHDGYERLRRPVRHRRTWLVRPHEVTVVDTLEGSGVHEFAWTLVLAPEVDVRADASGWRLEPSGLHVEPPGPGSALDPVDVARGFGTLEPSRAIRWRTTTTVPAIFEARLTLQENPLTPRSGQS